LNEYFLLKYKEAYMVCWINFLYKCMYIFTSFQIWYNKLYNCICDILETVSLFLFDESNNLEFVLNCKIIYSTSMRRLCGDNDISDNDTNDNDTNDTNDNDTNDNDTNDKDTIIQDNSLGLNFIPNVFDFIVYSYKDSSKNTLKKIIKHFPTSKDADCEASNVKFILIEFLCGKTSITLQFKTENESYYVVGNVFNTKFIKYFMKTQHNIDVTDDYTLNILDHNVQNITFDKNTTIKINKDSYELITE
jgi:hypothetical protein